MITKTLFVLYSPDWEAFVGIDEEGDEVYVDSIESACFFLGLAEATMNAQDDEEVLVVTITYELPEVNDE